MDRELQVTHGFGRQGISRSNGYNGSGVLFGPSNRLVPCTFLLSTSTGFVLNRFIFLHISTYIFEIPR